MFAKKRPVLTATFCDSLEKVRTAIEVLTGERTCFVRMDFNTGRGIVCVGYEQKDISFYFGREDLLHFSLGESKDSNTALFGDNREVFVMNSCNPNKRVNGQHTMRWFGYSATNRQEKPLHPKDVEYCAKVRGLTVEEYLNI